MFKLDNELIKDKFLATTYNFYTDEEIEKISVKKIVNPTAFDHLGNPTNSGIYDKSMGVSPFDHRSQCVTCGLDSNYCPGHVGHIELTAPIYNPFLINHLYKLLKAKCQHCHRIRIHPQKIEIYIKCLKLIKSGDVVASNKLKSYFLYAAKDVQLINENEITDPKKLQQKRKVINLLIEDPENEDKGSSDLSKYFRKLERKLGKLKQKEEQELDELFNDIVTDHKEIQNDIAYYGFTSVQQKALKEMVHEIQSQIVPMICPHCNGKSQSFRKDGYTKFFLKAFSEKVKTQIKQSERLQKDRKSSVKDDNFEIITEASTAGHVQSRKQSNTEQSALDEIYSLTGNDIEEEEEEEDELDLTQTKQRYISPMLVKDHIEKFWQKEKQLLDLLYGRYYPGIQENQQSLGPKMFFTTKILVPPNRFRPESQGAFGGAGASQGDKAYLHAHSTMLTKILNANLALKDALLKSSGDQEQENSHNSEVAQKWIQLQDAVNTFVDSSMAQKTADKDQGGIRQLLEKKEGMFRMKMMGKRVNFGARSVISPDPYITTDQIGVPLFMAKKLTFPEPVSIVNMDNLRQMVINGPHQHPGANIIEDEETGVRTHLDTLNYSQRRGLSQLLGVGRKIVYRHLQNGDVLLVNRQPTLHKPSLMAHLAKVLPKEQTIRMHYANCSTYNADFDGDEMNLHFPQSYLACSEAYNLMATHRQYIVPTSGKPIRGLIQDCVVSGVFLSSKDTLLTKEQYQQLVYIGLRELIEEGKISKIFTLQPAILKPSIYYTGKQVFSTILKNIVNQEEDYKKNKLTGMNLDSKSKVSGKEWGKIGQEEGEIVIRDNEILQGTIDKNQFGASEYGMMHSFYEIYGSEKAGELLTSLARIFTMYLQVHGFTCGLDDLVLTPDYNKQRRMLIEKCHKEGVEAAAEFCGWKNHKAKQLNYSNRVVFQSGKFGKDEDIEKFNKMSIPENPFKNKQIIQEDDAIRKSLEEKISSSEDTIKTDEELDGAMRNKMSNATSQVLKLCLPEGLVKRFPRNNISTMVLTGAKGGLVNMTQISCMLGQQELEGKRVPKMQNGKTLPCYLPYDPNPRSGGYVTDRFISGLRPQDFFFHCMAGREGLIDTAVKTSRSGYLQRCLIKQLESIVVNYDMTVRDNDGSIIQFMYGEDSIDVIHNKYLDKFKFLEQNFTSLITNYNGQEILQKVDRNTVEDYKLILKKQLKKLHKEYPTLKKQDLLLRADEPALSKYHPLKYFGSISEKMDQNLKRYLENECQSVYQEQTGIQNIIKSKFKPIKPDTFKKMYYLKYMKSIVDPGENVGTLAAQSVGEPSTQMTLNTFHLAGHGAGNMTLGIPRLKEILMTTPNNIKTPIMKLYFRKGLKMDIQEREQFANKFKRLKLADIVKEVKVSQSISQDEDGSLSRIYNIQLEFEDCHKMKKTLGIRFKQLLQIFSDQFVPLLMSETFKQLKKASSNTNETQFDTQTVLSKAQLLNKQNKKKKTQRKQTGEELDQEYLQQEEEMIRKESSQRSKSKKDDDEIRDEDEDEDDDIDKEYNSDIDGVNKKQKKGNSYEQEDEDDKILKAEARRQSHQNQDEQEEYGDEDIAQFCNILREKFQKYFGYIRKIYYEQKKSITVTLGFPLEVKKVLMLTVAENVLNKVLIRSIQGIDQCVLVKPEKQDEEPYIIVQGINFDVFYQYSDIVDVNRIETNDICAMKRKYGIEACRANLLKEVRTVFNMYGIEVNYRHLSLISDFITFNGDYRAFNRIGMEESSSPFLKMSFETTMRYLINSCVNQDRDDLSTPASALVLGQVPKVGTGVFDLIQDPDLTID